MRTWYLIDTNGSQVGVVFADTEEEAIETGLYELKVADLDHVHHGGNVPVPCQFCERIQRDIQNYNKAQTERKSKLH